MIDFDRPENTYLIENYLQCKLSQEMPGGPGGPVTETINLVVIWV